MIQLIDFVKLHSLTFGQKIGHQNPSACHCEPQALSLRRGNLPVMRLLRKKRSQ
jgi:hypothetical protein